MPISTVDVYEKLKPQLGEEETKILLSYVEERVDGNAATKEDIQTLLDSTKEEIGGIKEDIASIKAEIAVMKGDIASIKAEIAVMKATMATKEDIHQLRLLVVIVIAAVVLLNPKILELIGSIFGIAR